LHLGIFEHPAKTYFFSNQLSKSAAGHGSEAGDRPTSGIWKLGEDLREYDQIPLYEHFHSIELEFTKQEGDAEIKCFCRYLTTSQTTPILTISHAVGKILFLKQQLVEITGLRTQPGTFLAECSPIQITGFAIAWQGVILCCRGAPHPGYPVPEVPRSARPL
jgi:hypothetical protein